MKILTIIKRGGRRVFLAVLFGFASFTVRPRKSFATEKIPVVSFSVSPNQETKIVLKPKRGGNEEINSFKFSQTTERIERENMDDETDYIPAILYFTRGRTPKALITFKERNTEQQAMYDQKELNKATQGLYNDYALRSSFIDTDNFLKINSVGKSLDGKTYKFYITKKLEAGHPFRKSHINFCTGKKESGAVNLRTCVFEGTLDPVNREWKIIPPQMKNFLDRTTFLNTDTDIIQQLLEENKNLRETNEHLLKKLDNLEFKSK